LNCMQRWPNLAALAHSGEDGVAVFSNFFAGD
jgi:hypothetical protein